MIRHLGILVLAGVVTSIEWDCLPEGWIINRLDEEPNEISPPSINGVYSLSLEGRSFAELEPYLNNPDVDGFSLRTGWFMVEPTEGTYDWSPFDLVVAHAADYGKKIMLRVLAGRWSPSWVYDAGAVGFSYVEGFETVSMPAPWDPVYLTKWLSFVAVLGARYADNPAVTIVAITGPGEGGEMHLVDKYNQEGWHAVGYSNAALINAWQQTIDSFVAAFPAQHLTVAVARPVFFDNPTEVVDEVAAYCEQMGCGIQGNWLSAGLPPSFDLYQQVEDHSEATAVGFQMLSSASRYQFGGDLSEAIDLGLDAGASYLEVYKVDITDYPSDIAFAHEQLESP